MEHTGKRPGPPPLTIGQMQALAAGRGGRCLSAQYVNANTHLEWECAQGHRWLAIPNSVKRGSWCRICAGVGTRRSLADIQSAAVQLGGHCLSDRYVNGTTSLLFECSAGHRWEAKPASVLAGHWCRQCLFAQRRTPIAALRDMAASRGGQCLSESYTSKRQRLRWRCASGHEWESTVAIVRGGHWCPHCQRQRTRTGIDRMREIAAQRGGRCLSDHYVNAGTHLQWQCGEGHVWEASATKAQQGQWCPYCSGHRHSIGEMQALARERHGECLSHAYVSSHDKLQWRCEQGHTWQATPAVILRGYWCPQCGQEHKRSRDMERMHALAAQRGGQCLSGRYLGASTPLRWQCGDGHSWEMAPVSIIGRGRWCPYCSGRRKYTLADMQSLARERGGKCLSVIFQSSNDLLQWQCARGHDWSVRATSVVAGRWCPQCQHENKRLERMHALAAQRGGQCLSGRYLGASTPLRWKCGEGHSWEMAPADLIRSERWCPHCSKRRRYTLADMQAFARERGGECLSNAFQSVHAKLQWQCDRGHVWSTLPVVIIRGHWCPECAILERCVSAEKKRRYQAVTVPDWDPVMKDRARSTIPDEIARETPVE